MRLAKLLIPLVAVSSLLLAQIDPPGRVGRLNFVSGPVSFQPAGVTDWVEASVNRPLTTGDQVWVGDGARAEVRVGSTAFRLDSNTAFQFLNLDDRTMQVRLSEGNLTVSVRNLDQDQVIELDTPSMAFNVTSPGQYRITAVPDSQNTTVTVRSGQGEVTGGGSTFPVQAREQAIVSGGDQINYNIVGAPGLDGWDQWNSSRDRAAETSVSARYVSREVPGYEDLDRYGDWQDEPGYGHVWMPSSVGSGWAPYQDGHWAWIAPWGWTWVDDAPWGFAPFHYGRWASFRGRWGWVPGPYGVAPLYAPALVGWIGGGGGGGFSMSFSFGRASAVGWFPLGPREPYFPASQVSSRYFGRVNNSNTVINNTVINNYYNNSRNSNNTTVNNIRYVNQAVPNAVTAVPQDRFANGRRVTEIARPVSSAQIASAPRFSAAPPIAPQRVSVIGAAAASSRTPRPPAAVLSRPVVARTAPPPPAVPFERAQAQLNRNPGRPLPPVVAQQAPGQSPARVAPVRVLDMSKVQRVQPVIGAAPQRSGNPAPGQNQAPPVVGRTDRPPTAQPQQQNQRPSEVARPSIAPGQQVRPDRPPNAQPQQQSPRPPEVVRPPNAVPQQSRPDLPPTAEPQRQNQRLPEAVRPPNASPQQSRPYRPPTAEPQQQNQRPAEVVRPPNAPSQQARPDRPPAAEQQRQNQPPPEVVRPRNAPPEQTRPDRPPTAERQRQNQPPPEVVRPRNAPPEQTRPDRPPAAERQRQNQPPPEVVRPRNAPPEQTRPDRPPSAEPQRQNPRPPEVVRPQVVPPQQPAPRPDRPPTVQPQRQNPRPPDVVRPQNPPPPQARPDRPSPPPQIREPQRQQPPARPSTPDAEKKRE